VGEPLPPDEVPAEVAAAGTASVRVMVGEPVRERAYRATEFLLAGASSRVWVTDAYLVAPRRLYQALTDAAKAGVDVRLLVPGTSDLPLVRNLTRIGYRELLRAGVRIYEWNGPMLHAKTVVADGRWVRVGSSNLNHSSLLANYELDVLIDDERLATKMEAQFRLDIDQSAEVRVRPLRAPSAITRMLPPALAIPDPGRPSGHRRGMRERRGRSVLVVRTLAAGARLAVFGPVSLALALVAVLFFVIPKAMGILFGTFSLWLSLVAGAEAIHRRRDG
jgi:cardiolipin synthase